MRAYLFAFLWIESFANDDMPYWSPMLIIWCTIVLFFSWEKHRSSKSPFLNPFLWIEWAFPFLLFPFLIPSSWFPPSDAVSPGAPSPLKPHMPCVGLLTPLVHKCVTWWSQPLDTSFTYVPRHLTASWTASPSLLPFVSLMPQSSKSVAYKKRSSYMVFEEVGIP